MTCKLTSYGCGGTKEKEIMNWLPSFLVSPHVPIHYNMPGFQQNINRFGGFPYEKITVDHNQQLHKHGALNLPDSISVLCTDPKNQEQEKSKLLCFQFHLFRTIIYPKQSMWKKISPISSRNGKASGEWKYLVTVWAACRWRVFLCQAHWYSTPSTCSPYRNCGAFYTDHCHPGHRRREGCISV